MLSCPSELEAAGDEPLARRRILGFREAKRRQQLRQTVALTARTTDEDREIGMRAGFDHYLTKPLEFEKLRGVLSAG